MFFAIIWGEIVGLLSCPPIAYGNGGHPFSGDIIDTIETGSSNVGMTVEEFSEISGKHILGLIRKQRTICYLLPGEQRFLTAFVFGEKATASVRASDLPASVVIALNEARVYAEGRGIRLETRTRQDIETMKRLAAIKMAP